MTNIIRLWRGDVNRWHSHPSHKLRNSGDTIHKHSARCGILLAWLNPSAPASMINDCLHHDAAETITGDVPYGAKRGSVTFKAALDGVEEVAFTILGIRQPTCCPWIKLVDNLDAYLWMLEHDPALKEKPDWRDMRTAIIKQAAELGRSDDVVELIMGAENGG